MTSLPALNRLQRVEGTHNLRDVGGYRADGGTTAWGRIFRSDGLHRLTPQGLNALQALKVKNVIDLRDDNERLIAPDLLPDGATLIPQPIFPDAFAHVQQNLDVAALTELIYLQYADSLASTLQLLSHAEGASVVHCTAGKDRTGAVIALTLTAVGVDRDDVLHDYAETEQNLKGPWLEQHLELLRKAGAEITPEVLALVSASPAPVLERALKLIDHEYGSVRDYLVRHGLKESSIESLHSRLVS